jgi:WD40 repeat protein
MYQYPKLIGIEEGMNLRTPRTIWLVVGMAVTLVIVTMVALDIWIFSPDPNEVHVFDMQKIITTVAISADERVVAVGNDKGRVHIWEIQEGLQLRQSEVHACAVTTMAFSPDSRYLITGGEDGAVFVWDIATGTPLHSILDVQADPCTFHGKDIRSIAVHPAGSIIAVSIYKTGVQLIDVKSGEIMHTFRKQASGGPIEHLAFSADGERLLMVYYDATVQIVNMVDNQIMCEFERVSDEVVSSAALTPNDHVRMGTFSRVEEWSVSPCSHLQFRGMDPPSDTRIVTLNADGSHVILSGRQRIDLLGGVPIFGEPDPRIFMINIEHPERRVRFRGHESYVNIAAVSHSGEMLVSGSADGTVRLWRVPAFEE